MKRDPKSNPGNGTTGTKLDKLAGKDGGKDSGVHASLSHVNPPAKIKR
jgi:hypothetical protein